MFFCLLAFQSKKIPSLFFFDFSLKCAYLLFNILNLFILDKQTDEKQINYYENQLFGQVAALCWVE
jgi:hypothetical protein